MTFIPIEGSSNVAAAGYDAATHVITVQFRDGRSYSYGDKGPEVWAAFQAAESKGRFVRAMSGQVKDLIADDASVCCKATWGAAARAGKLPDGPWECPKCGCQYTARLVGGVRYWEYSSPAVMLR